MHVELNSRHSPPNEAEESKDKASSHQRYHPQHSHPSEKKQVEGAINSRGERRDSVDLESKQTAIAETEAEEKEGLEADRPDRRSEEKMEDFLVEVSATPRRVTKWTMGIICVIMVAVIWAGASVLVQYIFQNRSFNAPFFLTFVCNSLFLINLPCWFLLMKLGFTSDVPNGVWQILSEYSIISGGTRAQRELSSHHNHSHSRHSSASYHSGAQNTETTNTLDDDARGNAGEGQRSMMRSVLDAHGPRDLDRKELLAETRAARGETRVRSSREVGVKSKLQIFKISAIICPLWFLANWTYNVSLSQTSVTSSTVISNTSTLWTFVFSICVLSEKFSWMKVFGVVLCMLGNFLTTLNDGGADTSKSTMWGDVICMFSAMMYGVYTVVIRKLIPDEESVSLPLFFGFLGLINMSILAPVVAILHYTGVEPLGGLDAQTFGLISVKGILDNVVSDYLWAIAVLLTTPTVATIGLSLTIPLAILSDLMIKAIVPTIASISAAVVVIAGFLIINLASSFESEDDENNAERRHAQEQQSTGLHQQNNIDEDDEGGLIHRDQQHHHSSILQTTT